jgi:FtsP/CotA-like multicopper oxidase with cupredoxin domain
VSATFSAGVRRRTLFGLVGAAGAGGLLAACGAEISGKLLTSKLPLPERFVTPLPIPQVARPTTPGRYDLVQRAVPVEIVPGTKTTIWGYDGTFPGPTFDVKANEPISVRITNELPVPTSTHLHGGVTAHDSDGFPTDLIVPAAIASSYQPGAGSHMPMAGDPMMWTLHTGAREYAYSLNQRAATLWYHDHRMDFTAPQVYRGLAGMFIVRDAASEALPLPAGERDIPLMICDRAFEADGSFRYPAADPRGIEPGVTAAYMQGVEGDVILVNGAPWPVFEVDAARYRLRFLNASNARRYQLSLSPGPRSGAAFTQVGSDVGLLGAPAPLDTFTIAPAERFEMIVDFGQYPVGTEVVLTNSLGSGATKGVMKFKVVRSATDDSTIPATLVDVPRLDTSEVSVRRTFDFRRKGNSWTINGNDFDPMTSIAQPKMGSTEMWTFSSDFHHPVHLHLGHFQVQSRNAGGAHAENGDAGWKDTVDLRPYELVQVIVRFPQYRGRYLLHCHNLEHEDMSMMATFDIV